MQIRSMSDWQCEIGQNCLETKSLGQPRHIFPDFFLNWGVVHFLKNVGWVKMPTYIYGLPYFNRV